MANEEDANKVRQQHGRELMKMGAHAIGVEEGTSYGKQGWVVVAHVEPKAKVDLPSSLSYSNKDGKVDVPVVIARSKPYALELKVANIGAYMPSFVLRRSIVKPNGPLLVEPESVRTVGSHVEPLTTDIFLPEMVGRNCHLEVYTKVKVPHFDVDQEIIAYCSPDSTYAVTKRLFDNAKKTILIGIYDFSADYMTELLLDALKRHVKIKLMLDIDSKEEQALFDELNDSGVDGVPAPSCASHRVHFFSSSHEKVIVVDGEWCLIQSGNYSENSIPLNVKDGGDRDHFRPGNRDTGLAFRSKKLPKFFAGILESDMALEINGPEALAQSQGGDRVPGRKRPDKGPDTLFPSKTFKLTKPLNIQPV